MIKNEIFRIWVNRVLAFLAGGLLIFIVLQFTVVSETVNLNEKLSKELDSIKYASGRLLDEGKVYFEKGDFVNAKTTLNALFEKHPTSKEATEGKTLYARIESIQAEMDDKWDAAVTGIREEWKKTKAIQLKDQLREQFEKDREKLDKDMDNNLDMEWNRMKDQIRTEWEKQI